MRYLKMFAVMVCAVALLVPCAASAAVKVGDPAPEFELPVWGSDASFKLADMKGKKAVVIAITQSACSSCRTELDLLNNYVGQGDLEVVTINVDARGGTEKWNGLMTQIVKDAGWKMPVLVDPKYSVPRMFGVRATPGLIVIGKDGTIKAIEIGFVPGEDNESFSKIVEAEK